MNKEKIIRTPYGVNRELSQEFGISQSTVSAALHGKSKSLRALKIRKRAKEILKEFQENY